MGFNYRRERRKFEKQMEETEKKYRAAGMSDEQINAMREFEEDMFRQERVYKIHIVLESSNEHTKLIELASTHDSYFQELKTSLNYILDNLAPGFADHLTEIEKEIILLQSFGLTQSETGRHLGVSQSKVSRSLKKFKRIFENLHK